MHERQSRISQRLARPADGPAIAELMRQSVLALFPKVYTAQQSTSAATYIAHLDPVLIADGTYFVHEAGAEIVACGGWSRRAKLYTGSGPAEDDLRLLDPRTEPARVRAMFVDQRWTRRGLGRALLASAERAARLEGFRDLILMATLPGVPLYAACGFSPVEQVEIPMPDGSSAAGLVMTRPIGQPQVPTG